MSVVTSASTHTCPQRYRYRASNSKEGSGRSWGRSCNIASDT